MNKNICAKSLLLRRIGEKPKWEEIPIDYDPNNDVLIRVYASMFGKALHRAIFQGHPKITPPTVLGSLISGEIMEGDCDFPKGTAVLVNPHHPCGECASCQNNQENLCNSQLGLIPGGMSDIVCVRGNLRKGIHLLPANVSFAEGVYTELVACVLESINKVYEHDSDNVVIVGCGLIAMLHIQIAKAIGIKKIFCIANKRERIDLIREQGGIPIILNKENFTLKQTISKLTNGRYISSIVDAAGSSNSFQCCMEIADPQSQVILFGGYACPVMPVDVNKIHYNNITIRGSYHFSPKEFDNAIEMMRSGKVKITPLITGVISYMDIDKIYANFVNMNNISNVVVFKDI